MCSDHFEDSQFMNCVTKEKLRWDAVPTIFSVPNPPKRLQSVRPYRGKEVHSFYYEVIFQLKLLTS
jgi:hypothetical protein